jgi:RNA-directed DNA polymerase
MKRVCQAIHEETLCRSSTTPVESRIRRINQILQGWCGYFNQGPVQKAYKIVMWYTEQRIRRWLMRKHKRRGTGYRQYSSEMLYERFGLYKPLVPSKGQSSAKA